MKHCISRKDYGGAYDAMSSKHPLEGRELREAGAEIAVMGANEAVDHPDTGHGGEHY